MSSASAEASDPAAEVPVGDGGGSGHAVPLPARASEATGAGRVEESDWSVPVWAEPTAPESTGAQRSTTRIRRWGLVVAVLLVAVVVAAGEVIGRRYLDGEVERRLRDNGMTGGIEVTVGGGWRPVVLPAVLGAGLDRLTIRITDGTVGGLPVQRAEYDLRGIRGDVSLRSGTVRVRSIGSGAVRIAIDPAALEPVTTTSMRIRNGLLVAGEQGLPVTLDVRDDFLVLGGEAERLWGMKIEIPVIDDQLLPCVPRVRVVDDSIVLSCRGRTVPGILLDPLEGDPSPTAPAGELVPPQSTILGGTGDGTDVGPAVSEAVPSSETTVPVTTAPVAAPTETVPAVVPEVPATVPAG